jgi:hypothetical protein
MLFKFNYSNKIHQAFRSGGFLLFLFLLPQALAAQTGTNEMSKDENGKYIYYQIADKIIVPADSLHQRCLSFFKMRKFKNLAQKDDQLVAEGKMIINKTAFVLTHPSGEILFNFTFETKPGKYRFWLTDFLFIPYSRDRYGNFVATTAKGRPLENLPGKLNAAEWKSYIDAAYKQSDALGAEFKQFLSRNPSASPVTAKPKTISTTNW